MDRTVCTRCKTRAGVAFANAGACAGANGNATVNRSRGGVALRAGPADRVMPVAEVAFAPVVPEAPLPAPAPDAAPRGGDHVLRAVAHAVVLLSVVGFVVAYCVVIPVRRQMTGARGTATVRVVAESPVVARGPDVEGLFVARRTLRPGDRVRSGELLGHIRSPKLEEELAAATTEIRALQVRLLRLEQWNLVHELTPHEATERRELSERLEVVAESLARLQALRSKLAVRAPADGVVQERLAATLDVAPHQPIVSLYADGGGVTFEVSGPIDVLNELRRDGQVTAEFAMPQGVAKVVARPVGDIAGHALRQDAGREGIWGVLRCVPDELPSALRSPGVIGKLAS